MFSLHGLLRAKNMQLGHDADTGGPALVVERPHGQQGHSLPAVLWRHAPGDDASRGDQGHLRSVSHWIGQ